tara:strand:- start:11071 stop:11931 length:861 start_codon:yes stop_codon:yes gene_type:complete
MNEATFFAGDLAEPSNLTVSELMYNPPGSSEDLEFIELVNLSRTDTIELGGATFTEGMQFSFPINTRLAPGGRLLLVSDEEAFVSHYGPGLPVVGQYDGLLDNSGEQLVIENSTGNVILNFTYNDGSEWPSGSDGEGYSLVSRDSDLSDALSWRDSDERMGNPGESDNTRFSGLPSTDEDGDGVEALLEYATGGDDRSPGDDLATPVLSISRDGPLEIMINLNLSASDIDISLEQTSDLVTWEPLVGFERIAIIRDQAKAIARIVYRATTPQESSTKFLRLRAILR